MEINIVTREDLEGFKEELLTEIQKLLVTHKFTKPARKWLKSHEVLRLLTISPGTLQHMRVSGKLPFTKIGGVIYYDYDDIQKMLEEHKSNKHPNDKEIDPSTL